MLQVAALMFGLFANCDHLSVAAEARFADPKYHFAYHILRTAANDGLFRGGYISAIDKPSTDAAAQKRLIALASESFANQILRSSDELIRQWRSGQLFFTPDRTGQRSLAETKLLVRKIAFHASCCERIIDWVGRQTGGNLLRESASLIELAGELGKGYYRFYTYKAGSRRPTYEPDPSKEIDWIDAAGASSSGIGHGLSGEGGIVTIHPGGRIRFVDGTVQDFEFIALHKSVGRDGRIEAVNTRVPRPEL